MRELRGIVRRWGCVRDVRGSVRELRGIVRR